MGHMWPAQATPCGFINVDNVMRLLVDGEVALECTIDDHSCYLTPEDFPDRGRVEVQLENTDESPATYGYEIWKDGALWKADACGLIRRSHCENLTKGPFKHELQSFVIER